MPIFQIDRAAEVKLHGGNDVHLIEVRNAIRADRVILPDHAIVCLKTDVCGTVHWEGERQAQRVFPAGTFAFVPAGSEIVLNAENLYSSETLRIGLSTFEGVVGPGCDIRRLESQPGPLSGGLMTRLVASMTEFARGADVPPELVASVRTSLAIAAAHQLAGAARIEIPEVASGMTRERKRRVLEFIGDNLDRQFTLTDMAEVAALSPYHFARLFQRAMGVTPLRYVAQRRMERAKQLLGSPAPIAEVALQCGYANQSHFTAAFKAATGMTPKAFRRAAFHLSVLAMALLEWGEWGVV